MRQRDFLLEIGSEELPSKTLKQVATALANGIQQRLLTAELGFAKLHTYATPRRLAVLIENLNYQQTDRTVERRGPALRAAYDAEGKPTQALLGFARSCKTELSQLEKLETPQGSWLIYRYTETGKTVKELLPIFIQQTLAELPIAKPMRWGALTTEFARPAHWIVMLYGNAIIPATILGLPTGRITYGHRFHHPKAISLTKASDYVNALKSKGHVIADFAQRRELIHKDILKTAAKAKGHAVIDENLLDEVTGLVEWPTALLIPFDKAFLKLPKEVLITCMQHHQKCFALADKKHKLLPQFITLSNIKSKKPPEVIRGNERVMRARLSDAKFFYETDCKQKLSDRLETLKHVVFQAKLGSLFDKAQRLEKLAAVIERQAARAGLLCKTDLVTAMVGEFPELQGIMGKYYAEHDGESAEVAQAIAEHYLPRFAGDKLPESRTGCAVALADRIDTLVGIFSIKQAPTGDKDPFSLRRAALGILRILIEKKIDLNLYDVIETALRLYYPANPIDKNLIKQIQEFILERLPSWYQEQGITADKLAAVLAARVSSNIPLDIHHRVLAIHEFAQRAEAAALIEVNKRIKNILKDKSAVEYNQENLKEHINIALLNTDEEKALYETITSKYTHLNKTKFAKQADCINFLIELADLQKPMEQFFDKILVNAEDQALKNNRLELLNSLRYLFLTVADISLLQK